MITLKHENETTLVVKKSRFIGYICPVQSEEEAQRMIEQRRKRYYDARHHCFAWVLENGAMRYGDDGEPQGTAGLPMLEVLKKSGLQNVLAVCTRYFGGTLLGAGGLARAYTQSVARTLETAQRVRLVMCSVYRCAFDFAMFSRARAPLINAGYPPENVAYAQTVTADIGVPCGGENAFLRYIQNLTQGQVTPALTGARRRPMDV